MSPSEIQDLVYGQPEPHLFYKSFLELDGSNIVSILAFDSKSMAMLLDEENSRCFDPRFPLIYKNKIYKKNN